MEETTSGYHIVHMGRKKNSILWEKRMDLRLTQREVAERAHISLVQYNRFENGDRNIMTASFQSVCRIVEVLGMDPTKFFHGEYVIGEEVFIDDKGTLRYKNTGHSVNEEAAELRRSELKEQSIDGM